ncbi:hypothetical protein [Methanosarcina sp. 1.H.T.1A.1]|uniref:hypothetical protein n=1 Tax=Methanosarcina sp. 1.H.T.1A.1 TaxID=1483602 RepID=UPI001F46BFFB|nr:hypothetical protein [Methanosarcina sp. 1.H.T.1A.1]
MILMEEKGTIQEKALKLKRLVSYLLPVIIYDEEIVAFANIWAGGKKEELSVDLMRYGSIAPDRTM